MTDLRVSMFLPVFKDEDTIRIVVLRSLDLLKENTDKYEIIIVNDGSPDRSGAIADSLAQEYDEIRVIHHPRNLGYGAALRSGFEASRYDWICMVDGDNEYDVFDLKRMLSLHKHFPLIIAFRYKKLYSTKRIFISYIYNTTLRLLFRSPFRDISTGIRVVHRDVLNEIQLTSNSPFIGAELAIKAMLRGYPVGELGIQTFPRFLGTGSSTTIPNILATIRDMMRVRREIFSDSYQLPDGRLRGEMGKTK